jgi:hypothetical protein
LSLIKLISLKKNLLIMKNSVIFIIVLLISTSLFSQPVKINPYSKSEDLKSGLTISQDILQADSIITFQFISPTDSFINKKEYNTFDEQNQINRYESWTWNNNSESWRKYAGIQQQIGDTTIITYNNWDADSGVFIPTGKAKLIEQDQYFGYYYFYYMPSNQTFIGQSKNEEWFNSEGNDSLYIEYNFNSGLNQWDNKSKTEYKYDTLQNLTEENGFGWKDTYWELNRRTENGYDTLGNLTFTIHYMGIFGILNNSTRYLFTFDSLNNRVNIRLFLFNNNQWNNERNTSYQFDDMNRNILILEEKWNANDNEWNNERKILMEYEDVEKSAKKITALSTKNSFFNWNSTSQEWIPDYESTNVLNEIGLSEEWWGKSWETNSETWRNFYKYSYNWNIENRLMLLQVNSTKNSEAEDWNANSKKYYYYNGINVFQSVSSELLKTVVLFPNPATDFVNVMQQTPKNINLKVFNLSGQLLVQSKLSGTNNPVNISSFNKGTYIFIVSDDTTSQSFKIMKF